MNTPPVLDLAGEPTVALRRWSTVYGSDGGFNVLGWELPRFRIRVVRFIVGIDPWRRRLAGPSGESIELHGAPAHRVCAASAWFFIARERVTPSALGHSMELEARFVDTERLAVSLAERQSLEEHATRLLDERAWRLLCSFGKVMEPGEDSGRYFSALTPSMARAYVDALAAGHSIPVHLMHRHRSGNYQVSRTRWNRSRSALVMVFKDREVNT